LEAWYSGDELERTAAGAGPCWGTRDQFLRSLLLAKLRAPFTDSLYSYRASRTVFEPYQFRPALKFLRNPDQRILIADEVGLGKTIEAAIIYLELKARLNISRVMVLCPSRLKLKWQDEMRSRFEEDFRDLDSAGVHQLLREYERLGDTLSFRAIASFETLRRSEFVDQLVARQLHLDLLIVDEAHHMRNTDTLTNQLGAILADNSDAVIFLTATPLHLGTADLYNLLHILAPSDFDDPHLFQAYMEPNQHINRSAQLLAAGRAQEAVYELRHVEHTLLRDRYVGNPLYDRVLDHMARQEDLVTRVTLQRELLELNTLSNVFTRTRKREVSNAAVRAAFSITVDLSPEEREFYEGVMVHVRRQLRRSIGHGAVGFAQVTKERQAASCLAATREVFEEQVRSRGQVPVLAERSILDLGEDDEEASAEELDRVLLNLARRLGDSDSKFEQFDRVLREVLTANSSSKVLVFSTFRRTLKYLYQRLAEAGYGARVIHGGVRVADRQAIIDDFRTNPDFRVLLSSEVGAEGLDFQFCDVLVNYDLPWNPMQVEQRIGRLDRFGQEHERIRIYNFYIAETIETRVFQRLYDRIGIFKQSIGDLEEILGEEIRILQKSTLQSNLTTAEQERLAENAAERIVRRQLEAEDLERQKDEFLGQQRIFSQQVLDAVNSGRVIHPEEVRAVVTTFLAEKFPNVEFTRDDEEPVWALTLTPELAEALRPYLLDRRRHYQVGTGLRRVLGILDIIVDAPEQASVYAESARIRHPARQVALTFDSEYARRRPLLEFVTLQHALAGLAIDYWTTHVTLPALNINAVGPAEETGSGYLFVFALDERGVSRNVTLHPIIILDDDRIASRTAETILKQIQESSSQRTYLERDDARYAQALQISSEQIAHLRDSVRDETKARNSALIRARSASVDASFAAKIRRTRAMWQTATEPRIQRLREGQLRNLEARRQSKLEELRRGVNVVVSYSLLAVGRVEIARGATFTEGVEDFEPLLRNSPDIETLPQSEDFSLPEDQAAENRTQTEVPDPEPTTLAQKLFRRWRQRGY